MHVKSNKVYDNDLRVSVLRCNLFLKDVACLLNFEIKLSNGCFAPMLDHLLSVPRIRVRCPTILFLCLYSLFDLTVAL